MCSTNRRHTRNTMNKCESNKVIMARRSLGLFACGNCTMRLEHERYTCAMEFWDSQFRFECIIILCVGVSRRIQFKSILLVETMDVPSLFKYSNYPSWHTYATNCCILIQTWILMSVNSMKWSWGKTKKTSPLRALSIQWSGHHELVKHDNVCIVSTCTSLLIFIIRSVFRRKTTENLYDLCSVDAKHNNKCPHSSVPTQIGEDEEINQYHMHSVQS